MPDPAIQAASVKGVGFERWRLQAEKTANAVAIQNHGDQYETQTRCHGHANSQGRRQVEITALIQERPTEAQNAGEVSYGQRVIGQPRPAAKQALQCCAGGAPGEEGMDQAESG